MTRHRSAAILPLLLLSLLAGACGVAATPTATVRPTPTPSPVPSPLPSEIPSPGTIGGILDVTLVSGPHCPVEQNPPQPGCEPQPVANATVVVRDAAGREIARAVSDATGHARLMVPGGAYTVEALPVQGVMDTPTPAPVNVAATGTTPLTVAYDTGIR